MVWVERVEKAVTVPLQARAREWAGLEEQVEQAWEVPGALEELGPMARMGGLAAPVARAVEISAWVELEGSVEVRLLERMGVLAEQAVPLRVNPGALVE